MRKYIILFYNYINKYKLCNHQSMFYLHFMLYYLTQTMIYDRIYRFFFLICATAVSHIEIILLKLNNINN